MEPVEQELRDLPILAVDDEEANLLLLRRLLQRAGYTRVMTTREPTEVPLLFMEKRPALVLLDLHMPEMDGFELMERLGPVDGVPFLVLTADATDETSAARSRWARATS